MTESKSKVKKGNWVVTPYRMADLSVIASFFSQVYKGYGLHGSMDYFQWKIADNSEREGVINLVRTPTGNGSVISLTPKVLFVKGEKLSAAEIGDTFTDPAYQRQGMFSMLVNQTRGDGNGLGLDFIYRTPNDQSLPGYEKYVNFKPIPGIDLRSLNFPVHVQMALQVRLPWVIAFTVGFLWTQLVNLWLSAHTLMNTNLNMSIEEVTVLPLDWDLFWDEARSNNDFLHSRERQYLKWLYFDSPYGYRVLISRLKGKINGYMVYRLVMDENMPTLRIAHYLSAPSGERVLASIFNRALRTALEMRAVKVSARCAL
jgi:hypothetical protein